MAKPPKKPKDEDIEIAPDAWERFEKTVDAITKPKQRKRAQSNERKGDQKKD